MQVQVQDKVRQIVCAELRIKEMPSEDWVLRKLRRIQFGVRRFEFSVAAAQVGMVADHLELELSHLMPMIGKLQRECVRRDQRGALDTVAILIAELKMLGANYGR